MERKNPLWGKEDILEEWRRRIASAEYSTVEENGERFLSKKGSVLIMDEVQQNMAYARRRR